MSSSQDFVIEQGTLVKYKGSGGAVVIPDGVTNIGSRAFEYCSGLESIIIPEGVTEIGWSAFRLCSNLASVIIPGTVTEINSNAFSSCSSLASVLIPGSVIEIGHCAFEGCYNLNSAMIQEGVKSIGASSFRGCRALISVTIPKSVTEIKLRAFEGCYGLKSVVIPEGVKSIENSTYKGCSSLDLITIPESVTEIGDSAFEGCRSLTSIVIPKHVTSIGMAAFRGCTKLADAQGFVIVQNVLFDSLNEEMNAVVIPDGVTRISKYAFFVRRNLISVHIPEGVQSIEDSAFYACERLKDVSLPFSLTSMGLGVFENCVSLSHISIPVGVTEILPRTFFKCVKLSEIIIPEFVTSIGESAFEGCTGLASITIPEEMTHIGNAAFKNCKSLDAITIPKRVGKIGKAAFHGCSGLSSITVQADDIGIWKGALAYNKAPVIIYGKGFQTKDKLPTFLMDYPLQQPLTDTDLAYVLVYQSSAWMKWMFQQGGAADEVLETAVSLFDATSKVALKDAKKLVDYINHQPSALKGDVIQTVLDFLQRKAPSLVDELKKNKLVKVALGKATKKSIEEEVWASRIIPNEFVASEVKKGIPYAGKGGICAPDIVIGLITSYADLYYANLPRMVGYKEPDHVLTSNHGLRFIQEADRLAAKLNQQALYDLLYEQAHTRKYRAFLLALARYSPEKKVRNLIAELKTHAKGNGTERKWAENMKHALILSDTDAAAAYYDQIGELARYTKLRGISDVVYRDTKLLQEFPFDEHGVIGFDIGDNTIKLTVEEDLKLHLFDVGKQKAIRSFPTKSEKPERLQESAAQYEALKKEITGFIKDRTKTMKKMYLQDSRMPGELFLDKYLNHPILKQFSRLMIWMDQSDTCFAIKGNFQPVTVKDEKYHPQGEIRLAHVFDMSSEEISSWQKYLDSRRQKLLFAQIWEPIILDQDDLLISRNRYNGITLTQAERNELKRRLQERGIEVRADEMDREYDRSMGGYIFENEGNLNLGKYIKIEYSFDPDTKTTTFGDFGSDFSIPRRELNAIVFEMERARLRHAVKSDQYEVFAPALLSSLTVLQLNDLIQTAVKHQSTKCTALLLNYKNKHFSEFVMDEFTLD